MRVSATFLSEMGSTNVKSKRMRVMFACLLTFAVQVNAAGYSTGGGGGVSDDKRQTLS